MFSIGCFSRYQQAAAQNAMAVTRPLAGRGIVVTRPVHQSEHLITLLNDAGALPLLFPTIAILPPSDTQPLQAVTDTLDQFDLAVFVSPNAADRAMQFILARHAVPSHLKLAAIGRASARQLERHGAINVIAPARFDSEALLALPELRDVAGKRIVIFRGESGRELLGDTLTSRGAAVEHVACYRRVCADSDPQPLLSAWQVKRLHAYTATSSESVRNLLQLSGDARQSLQDTPLFVTHPRIEQSAIALNIKNVILTDQGDEGLMAGMTQWFGEHAAAVYSRGSTD